MIQVSIIIPAYNRAKILPRAIQSVLSQTFQDFEIIVVDDCSKDNTDEVMKQYHDPRIRYIKHAQNKGGSAARNTGIKEATGEFIAFLDSDDEWVAQKLEKQIALFNKVDKSYGVVYSSLTVIYEETGKTGVLKAEHMGSFLNELLISNCVRTLSSVVVRKQYLNAVEGLDASLKSCQDWDLYIRLMKQCKFDYIEEPLVLYYVNKQDPSRISNLRLSIIQGHETVVKKYKEDYKILSREERLRYFKSFSEMYALGGNLSHPFEMMVKSFLLTGNVQYLLKAFRYTARFVKGKFRKNHGY